MNMRNTGIAEGRLTKDPVVFKNQDGSRKIMFTIAAQDNFKSGDGKNGTQFIPVQAFVSKDRADNGVYDLLKKGTLVSVEYQVRNNNYTDKSGNAVYDIVLLAQSVDLKESKSAVDARAKAAESAAAGQDADEKPFA